ncbi:MAG: hypothetical protein ABJC74_00675 [Gemmatimonadota bacterium]
MPLLSRCFIRSGFLCLLLGLGLALASPLFAPAWSAALWPVRLHLLTVGWLTQLIFGVAWWLFPRGTGRAIAGRSAAGWASFGMLVTGLGLRAGFEPMRWQGHGSPMVSGLLTLSAGLQFVAAVAFAWAIWPRIRER